MRSPSSARSLALPIVSLVVGALVAAQEGEPLLTSGRPLRPTQSCYDVRHYALAVRVDPERRAIEGTLRMTASAVRDSDAIALDLHDALTVRSVHRVDDGRRDPVAFVHANGEIVLATSIVKAEDLAVEVAWGGVPRVAPTPPWDGGFVWDRTGDGAHWIATANQMQGPDLWWPCKDQPGDEPDSMDIDVTVPAGLVCASNGRLEGSETTNGWTTWRWRVTTPINAYGVALNIAPYREIKTTYTSVAGDRFPVTYWVLPENYEQGLVLFADVLRQIRFFEDVFGPYPFRADKYGVVETPHLGMEHQTITAYGARYVGNPWGEDRGFDFLHHHEMAHEWWANLVTARDWKDFWIHEGFATYAQPLYVERLHGPEVYREEMRRYRATLLNRAPIAPRETKSSAEVYFGAQGGDIYNKGAWVLHTLRFLLGDETFFRALRRMAYPDPALEKALDGSACRFTDTEEIRAIAEEVAGRDLGWFFEVYLRRGALPRLVVEEADGALLLRWVAPDELPFPMPIEVEVAGERRRVVPDADGVRVELPVGAAWEVDPHAWVLRELD